MIVQLMFPFRILSKALGHAQSGREDILLFSQMNTEGKFHSLAMLKASKT